MKIHEVEQNTPEWFAIRAGKPTASEASMLVSGTGKESSQIEKLAKRLAGESLIGEPLSTFDGNRYTEFGHAMEAESKDWYSFERNIEITECGFVTDDNELFGCSPDALAAGDGLAEFKNKPVKHLDTLLYWQKNQRPEPEYIPQCQMQMLVTGRQWCDLVYYSETLPKLIIRVNRDKDFIEKLKLQIAKCLALRDMHLKEMQKLEPVNFGETS